jgi:hypothetical protein
MRIAPAMLLLLLLFAACGQRGPERDGLGPRGTALPPPDPVTGEVRTTLFGR